MPLAIYSFTLFNLSYVLVVAFITAIFVFALRPKELKKKHSGCGELKFLAAPPYPRRYQDYDTKSTLLKFIFPHNVKNGHFTGFIDFLAKVAIVTERKVKMNK